MVRCKNCGHEIGADTGAALIMTILGKWNNPIVHKRWYIDIPQVGRFNWIGIGLKTSKSGCTNPEPEKAGE